MGCRYFCAASCSNNAVFVGFSLISLESLVFYNALFNYFKRNKLVTPQSVFLSGVSCIAQLLLIIREIQTAFDKDPVVEVSVVFPDISKAFDKVWHIGFLFRS